MKYKNNKQKKWGSFLAFLALAWPAFHLFRSTYTPTQVILAALFSFLAVRLWYFVYFKNKSWRIILLKIKNINRSICIVKMSFTRHDEIKEKYAERQSEMV